MYRDPNDPITYDVYIDTTGLLDTVTGNVSDTSYNPGVLDNDTWYFWKIIAKDDYGNETEGPIWSFFTGTIVMDIPCPGTPTVTDINNKNRNKSW